MNADGFNHSLSELRAHVRAARNFDLSVLPQDHVQEVVRRRLKNSSVGSMAEYVDLLEVKPAEYSQLFADLFEGSCRLLISPWLLKAIETVLVPLSGSNEPIRIWNVGCGRGEIAYLIAVLLCEKIGFAAFQRRVKIFATDADPDALGQSRQASFPMQALNGLPENLVEEYFLRGDDEFTFRSDLRRLLIFGHHDILQDPPISKMDLIIARYLLPCFDLEKQQRAIGRFRFALRDGRHIVLGPGTQLDEQSGLKATDETLGIFSKGLQVAMSAAYSDPGRTHPQESTSLVNDLAFDGSPVAHLVVDSSGILAIANARARITFGLVSGDFGRPLQDLEVSYRPVELRSLIEQANNDGHPAILKSVARPTAEGTLQFFDVYVRRLYEQGGMLLGTSIQYVDTTEFQTLKNELMSMNHQLQTANEEFQSAHEELETTNEELQSTNEELQTTNEELQSTNEELQTMNEELHSANSELGDTNVLQQHLTQETNSSNKFLEAILSSICAAVVVLSADFQILVWNSRAVEMFGLRADEVTGNNFFSLDIGLPVDKLKLPLREFVNKSKQFEKLTLAATNRRGKGISCRIRISAIGHGVGGMILIIDENSATEGDGNE